MYRQNTVNTSFGEFDAWNRLVSIKTGSTTLDAYTYDALGRRITENPGTPRDICFSSAWQVVEEDVSGTMQDQYVWSPVYVNAMIERDTSSQRLYVQQDGNWDVTALINTSGSVVERYIYDPYGGVSYLTATWATESSSAYSWIYLFQGGRLDTATGNYNFHARDLSPTLGRWLEVDPLAFGGRDVNLYRFAINSPVGSVDPSGLESLSRKAEKDLWHYIEHLNYEGSYKKRRAAIPALQEYIWSQPRPWLIIEYLKQLKVSDPELQRRIEQFLETFFKDKYVPMYWERYIQRIIDQSPGVKGYKKLKRLLNDPHMRYMIFRYWYTNYKFTYPPTDPRTAGGGPREGVERRFEELAPPQPR
jgi:RHS repeat-associated protein